MRLLPLVAATCVSAQSVPYSEQVESGMAAGSGTGQNIVAPTTKKHNTEGGINKVINLLKDMKAKIADDMERDGGIYDKFACYCKDEKAETGKRIEDNKSLLVRLTKSINLASSMITEAEYQIKFETANIAQEKKTQENLRSVLVKEEENFAKRRGEITETLNVLSRAVTALTKPRNSFLEVDTETKKQLALLEQLTGKSVGEGTMGAATGYLVEMKKESAVDLQQQTRDILKSRANFNHETLISMQAVAQHEEIKMTQEGILAKNKQSKGGDVKAYNAAKQQMDADVRFFDTLTADCTKRSKFYAGQVRDANAESDAIDAAMPILQAVADNKQPPVQFIQLSAVASLSLESKVDKVSRTIASLKSQKVKSQVLLALGQEDTSAIGKLISTCESMITTLEQEIKDVETNKATCLSETQRLTQEKIAATKARQIADDKLAGTIAELEHKTFELEDCQGKLARNKRKTEDLVAQCTATETTLTNQEDELKSEIAAINSAITELEKVYGDAAIGSQAESARYEDAGISRKEGQPDTDFSDTKDRRSGGGSIVTMLTMIRDQVAKNIGDTSTEAADSKESCTNEKNELDDITNKLTKLEETLNGEKVALEGQQTLDENDVTAKTTAEDNAQTSLEDYGNCAQKVKIYNGAITAKYADIDGLNLVISYMKNVDSDYREKAKV